LASPAFAYEFATMKKPSLACVRKADLQVIMAMLKDRTPNPARSKALFAYIEDHCTILKPGPVTVYWQDGDIACAHRGTHGCLWVPRATLFFTHVDDGVF